jgi:hypothetical protein
MMKMIEDATMSQPRFLSSADPLPRAGILILTPSVGLSETSRHSLGYVPLKLSGRVWHIEGNVAEGLIGDQ